MEDAQSATGFRGQFYYIVSPGEVIGNAEAYKFDRLNHVSWLTMEIDRHVSLMILMGRQGETRIFWF